MYGCRAGLGNKGQEEEGQEVRGAPPPTASLLSLCVRHCSLSHQSPTCSQAHRGTTSHTPAELSVRLCVANRRPQICLVRLWSLGSSLSLSLSLSFSSTVFFFFNDGPRPPAVLLSVKDKRRKKRRGGQGWTGGGEGERGHVSEREKNYPTPCGQT